MTFDSDEESGALDEAAGVEARRRLAAGLGPRVGNRLFWNVDATTDPDAFGRMVADALMAQIAEDDAPHDGDHDDGEEPVG